MTRLADRVVQLRPQRQPHRHRLHTTVMNEMSTSPGHTYTYDNAGNMISDNNGDDDHDLYV